MGQVHEARGTVRGCAVARICVETIEKEEEGADATPYFEELLDDTFCFRRANGATVGKKEFIASLAKGAGRALEGEVDVVHYEGIAVASLRVGVAGKTYRNIRIFVRGGRQGWRLQMWCNQQLA